VSFGLLNNQPPFFSVLHLSYPSFTFILHRSSFDFHSIHQSEADYLVSEQFSLYGVRLLASRKTPNLKNQGIPLRLAPNLDLSGMGDPTSSSTTAGIALRVSGALKPHHHDTVETEEQ
jgi:hypothetical protein